MGAFNAPWPPIVLAGKNFEKNEPMKYSMQKPLALVPILVLFTIAMALDACRFGKEPEAPPLPLSQKVSWGGKVAATYSDSLIVGEDSTQTESPFRIREFSFVGADTLHLRLFEYRQPYYAYAAFQSAASPMELADGFYRNHTALIFHHGRFIGDLQNVQGSLVPAEFLKENLAFAGEDLFSNPKEFDAFPLLGRVPHSERVITRYFLGRTWQGPVFTVSYRCHEDSATAFRAFAQDFQAVKGWMDEWQGKRDTLDWGREIHFQGWDEFNRPLIFWLFSEGAMGFYGCFDPKLAQECAKKMEKTAVLWPKP